MSLMYIMHVNASNNTTSYSHVDLIDHIDPFICVEYWYEKWCMMFDQCHYKHGHVPLVYNLGVQTKT